jgi:thermitase
MHICKWRCILIIFIFFAFFAPVQAMKMETTPSPVYSGIMISPDDYARDELIIRFRPEIASDPTRLRDVANRAHTLTGAVLKKDFGKNGQRGLQIVRVPASLSIEQAAGLYRNNPLVLYAEPNYKVSIATIPGDPSFSQQWALQNTGQSGGTVDADIDAPEAWDTTHGSTDVIIAVIDTGVDYTHPDLAANIWTNTGEIAGNAIDDDRNGYVDDVYGWNFYNNTPYSMDDHGHGTHCAGIIGAAGNNGKGITGVNWRVKIMPLKFMNSAGSGYVSDAAEAIWYAKQNGADIASNSYGGTGSSQTLKDAIDGTGIVMVCAAGNSGSNNDQTPVYPASYSSPNIIAVAATGRTDALASFSNYGASSVDVAAPGVDILSTFPGGGYTMMSGTSMATPQVAGIAGLLLSVRPDLTPAQVKDAILTGVDQKTGLSTKVVSNGRVNAYRALTSLTPSSALTITSISPVSGANSGPVTITGITGTGFVPGIQVKLDAPGESSITATNIVVTSGTLITCTFDLTGKSAGVRDVVVTNPDGQSDTLSGGFTITVPPPSPPVKVTGITPVNGYNNGTVQISNLAGSGFVTGSKPLLRKTGQADISATGITIVSSTKIFCTFNLNGKQAGSWDVVVTNPDGQSAILPGGFTITTPPPILSITGISPNSAMRGTTVIITSLSGSGFTNGAVVRMQKTGRSDIIATDIVVVSPSKITGKFRIPSTASTGYWNVRVTTPDGRTAVKNNAFNVRYY